MCWLSVASFDSALGSFTAPQAQLGVSQHRLALEASMLQAPAYWKRLCVCPLHHGGFKWQALKGKKLMLHHECTQPALAATVPELWAHRAAWKQEPLGSGWHAPHPPLLHGIWQVSLFMLSPPHTDGTSPNTQTNTNIPQHLLETWGTHIQLIPDYS